MPLYLLMEIKEANHGKNRSSLQPHFIWFNRARLSQIYFVHRYERRSVLCLSAATFNATCGLVFSEPRDSVQLDGDMRTYYDKRRGKQFFGFKYEDPKIAKSFFKLGQLANMAEYSTSTKRQELRNRIKTSMIVAWQFLS